MTKTRIQIVEDEIILQEQLRIILEKNGYNVISAVKSGEEAVLEAEKDTPDLILMDILLAGRLDGIDAAEIIRSKFNIPIIFLTAYLDKDRLDKAKLIKPFGYLLKPVKARDLKVTIEMALDRSKKPMRC